jgi:outer membrane lipoprotein-sorting protein
MTIVLAVGYGWGAGSAMLASPVLAADEPKAEEPKAEESADGDAKRFVEQSHAALANRRSVQANLYQVVNINGQPLKLTGRYANAGLKLRLELATELPGGAKGSLLEVCDGNVLWSQLQLLDSRRVTRRDIRQILAAVSAGESRPEAILTAELGLGGLPGLLAGLQRQLEFQSLERMTESGREMVVIRAGWKPDALTKLGLKPGEATPEYIPDLVRLWFDAETQVPVKIDYLKKAADKLPERAIVSLQFRDVVLDQPVDESLFLFIPPEDVVPEDITRSYVEQITRTGPNAPAAPQKK